MAIDLGLKRMASALIVTTLAIAMTGCYTADDGRKGINLPVISPLAKMLNGPTDDERAAKARKAELRLKHLTDPAREDDLMRVWYDIIKWTDALKLSDQRLSINSRGRFFGSKRHSETNFFIRASAETMREGYDGFVIVHLDYLDVRPKLISITPDISFAGKRWIGNYEDFRENLNEQNMFSGPKKARRKTMDGVIMMVNDEDYPNRDRFDANEIYMNYLVYQNP